MYDYHVHSNFSSDCNYPMEDMIKEAIKKSIKIISFTDHTDFDSGSNKYDFVFNTEDYFNDLNKYKNKYNGQIEIISGLELGMQPHLVKNINKKMNLEHFDFIIMSIHTVSGRNMYDGELFREKDLLSAYSLYYSEMSSVLDNFNDFDVVGHFNLIDRYAKYILNDTIKLDIHEELVKKVLQQIIAKDKGIEINTSGIRYGINSYHPTKEMLGLYKKLGGEIVTIGSDAHSPDDIGFNYRDVIELLIELDFRYITTFKDRKKTFVKIK